MRIVHGKLHHLFCALLSLSSLSADTEIGGSASVILGHSDASMAVVNPHSNAYGGNNINVINDGTTGGATEDTWAGDNTSGGTTTNTGYDYVGFTGLVIPANEEITRVVIYGRNYSDGGWFGTNGDNSVANAVAPTLQSSSDGGVTWSNVSGVTDNYTTAVGAAAGSTYNATFNLSGLTGVDALRLVGQTGGNAGGDANGFISVSELQVYTTTIQAPTGPVDVSFQSLLDEMLTSRETIAKWPTIGYTNKQASSYDRGSVSPSQGWFENGDRSYFVRYEQAASGGVEHVMMDESGPGAIVRWWAVSVSQELLDGTLRIYIDGANTPVVEGKLGDIIGGSSLVGAPLSEAVGDPSDPSYTHGRNLYMPIPYSQSCKVTFEASDGRQLVGDDPAWSAGDALFYNINYRTYEAGTKVESFTMQKLADAANQLATLGVTLNTAAANSGVKRTDLTLQTSLAAGECKSVVLDADSASGGSIRGLKFKLSASDLPQALRSTILEITFDGERTVWCPIGDFFGISYQINPTQSWYGSVSDDGVMEAHWVMPYQQFARVTLHNLGEQAIQLSTGEVSTGDWQWDGSSMYFGSSWRQYTNIQAKPDRDLNYVTLTGQGVYVGDTLSLFHTDGGWWGEGDEKIWVDGESFPSHFGTGTEDYYGYAWAYDPIFATPFIAQPIGEGNEGVGYTVNSRYRLLDGIPFNSSLQFDMELTTWNASRLNYAPATFWYGRPGVTSNVAPDVASAQHDVAIVVGDVQSVVDSGNGLIEGETLTARTPISGGSVEVQNSSQYGWSQNAQLWWRNGSVGNSLTLEFNAAAELAGSGEIELKLTKARDYGVMRITCNGDAGTQTDFDGYVASGVSSEMVRISNCLITEGQNTLEIEILAPNPSALAGNMFGIDTLEMIPDSGGGNTEGDFSFVDYLSGVAVTQYTGAASNVVIPDTLGGKSVLKIGGGIFSVVSQPIHNVTVSASVQEIEPRSFMMSCYDVHAVTVVAGNSHYASLDGVLFNKAMSRLIRCPSTKSGSYTVPATVTEIAADAFRGCALLTEIRLPSNLTSIGSSAFLDSPRIHTLIFSGAAPTLGDASVFANTAANLELYAPASGAYVGGSWDTLTVISYTGSPPVSGYMRWLAAENVNTDTSETAAIPGSSLHYLTGYALNMDLSSEPLKQMPRPVVNEQEVTYTFFAGREDIVYLPKVSQDMDDWDSLSVTPGPLTQEGYQTVTIDMSSLERCFIRLEVELAP